MDHSDTMMTDEQGSYFSVWLVPIEDAIEVPFVRSIIMQAAINPKFRLNCLLCEKNASIAYGMTPYVVIGYNETPGETNFLTCICERCGDGRSVDDLRPRVFDRIRETIMPDAKLVGLVPAGHA